MERTGTLRPAARVEVLWVALLAMLGGVTGGVPNAKAGNGYEQSTAGYSDGCF
jgi:hypothetical protein